MAFNGSGTFNRLTPSYSGATCWAQEKAGGFKIVASRHDTHDQDIASGLSNCITKDGQTTPTANISLGGFQLTNVGTGTARTHGVTLGQIQDGGAIWAGTSSGAANVYTSSLTPAITAYVTGMRVMFIAHQSNTGACTFGLNGLTATAIRKSDGSVALAANDILSGQVVSVVYNSAGGGRWHLLSAAHQAWQTWTPTLSPSSGGTTYSGTTFTNARYMVKDKICFWQLDFTTTASGTGYVNVRATVPITGGSTAYCIGRGNGQGTDTACLVTANSTHIAFSPTYTDFLTAVFSATALRLSGSGFYEVV